MKVNIFGVGRSGTKAIQVYLTYVLIRKHGTAWVNYEPYFWLNRKIMHRNYSGIYFDTTDNFFPNSADKINCKHALFLNKIVENKDVVVSKFIRGHGRILEINKIMKPQHTFVVIRDIYGVLNSLRKTGFDLFKIGKFSQLNFYDKQISDFQKNSFFEKRHLRMIKQVDNDQRRNAIIWYFYNLILLNYADAFFVNFKAIDAIEDYVSEFIYPNVSFQHNPLFNGHNIHTDNIFKDQIINLKPESIVSKSLLYTLNRFRPLFINKLQPIGSLCGLNEIVFQEKNKLEGPVGNTYLDIKDNFIDDLNNEIAEKLQNRICEQKHYLNIINKAIL